VEVRERELEGAILNQGGFEAILARMKVRG